MLPTFCMYTLYFELHSPDEYVTAMLPMAASMILSQLTGTNKV